MKALWAWLVAMMMLIGCVPQNANDGAKGKAPANDVSYGRAAGLIGGETVDFTCRRDDDSGRHFEYVFHYEANETMVMCGAYYGIRHMAGGTKSEGMPGYEEGACAMRDDANVTWSFTLGERVSATDGTTVFEFEASDCE